MAQAIIDPDELRRFARNLHQFNTELRDSIAALHGQMIGLADTWRDQEQEKFAAEFEQTTRVIEAFLNLSEQHIPFLQRKALRAEEYLQQQ